MKKFDIVVIGSGAGLMVIEAAVTMGLKCAIIEKSKFGGTCLTKGCIPSKMLVYPADLIRETEKSDRVGVQFKKPHVDWNVISKRMWKQINYSLSIEKNLKKIENLQVYNGTAEFTGKNTLRVRLPEGDYSEEIQGDIIVIAGGARSFVPPIKNIEDAGYITYETFFGDKYPKKPWKSLLIVGGGVIGAEFAHIFSAFGTKVTVLERNDRILSTEEQEISAFVEREFKNVGISVITNIDILDSGKNGTMKTLTVQDRTTGKVHIFEAEEIFIASGLRSGSDTLHLENTLVETDERGWIKTNEYLETTQENIYAIGDINGIYQFRHKANYEAEILIHNLFTEGEKRKATYDTVPWAVFTHPQVAHVGMTQEQAEKKGIKCYIGRNYYSQIAGGIALGINSRSTDNGFIKIIVDGNRRILGAHIVGPHASILIQSFVYLMDSDIKCSKREIQKCENSVCPQLSGFTTINESMVIHPSLNELTAWVLDNIDWSE